MSKWQDEAHKKALALDLGATKVVVAQHAGKTLPCVVLKRTRDAFRSQLSKKIPARVLMDLVTVLPFPTPFVYVMPVIFDDQDEPYWCQVLLHLIRARSMGGVEIRDINHLEPAHVRTRNLVRSFCTAPADCGICVVDDHGTALLSRIITLEPSDTKRFDEIREVIDFLDDFDMQRDVTELLAPTEIFNKFACTTVRAPDGRDLIVPAHRSLIDSQDRVYSIKVNNGRLIDRRVRDTFPDPKFDVFISHAHIDHDTAHALADALRAAWTELRIAFTKPDEGERFQREPGYFLEESICSRCLIYIATPNSAHRPMVDTEFGVNAGKPLITLLVGGYTKQKLQARLDVNLFLNIDVDLAFQIDEGDWPRFVRSIARTLDLPGAEIPLPDFSIAARRQRSDTLEHYLTDVGTIREGTRGGQSIEDATLLVSNVLQRNIESEGGNWERVKHLLGPHDRAAMLLLTVRDETHWRDMLRTFPALVDESLLSKIDLMHISELENGQHEAASKLARLRVVVREAVSGS